MSPELPALASRDFVLQLTELENSTHLLLPAEPFKSDDSGIGPSIHGEAANVLARPFHSQPL